MAAHVCLTRMEEEKRLCFACRLAGSFVQYDRVAADQTPILTYVTRGLDSKVTFTTDFHFAADHSSGHPGADLRGEALRHLARCSFFTRRLVSEPILLWLGSPIAWTPTFHAIGVGLWARFLSTVSLYFLLGPKEGAFSKGTVAESSPFPQRLRLLETKPQSRRCLAHTVLHTCCVLKLAISLGLTNTLNTPSRRESRRGEKIQLDFSTAADCEAKPGGARRPDQQAGAARQGRTRLQPTRVSAGGRIPRFWHGQGGALIVLAAHQKPRLPFLLHGLIHVLPGFLPLGVERLRPLPRLK